MANVGENWKCPYCGHAQVLAKERMRFGWERHYLDGWKTGAPAIWYQVIACANEKCRELTFAVAIAAFEDRERSFELTSRPQSWTLLPPSSAKPQPDYIPQPILDDYNEVCAIRDLSPKASATLTRRCLQGMIRDFCGISKKRLIDEVKELRSLAQTGKAPVGVQLDSIEAIDHVREVGNIGAHMEADINVIVDVDPDEAQILIELVELLFDEWYAREARKHAIAKLKSISADKKDQKQPKLTSILAKQNQAQLPPPAGDGTAS